MHPRNIHRGITPAVYPGVGLDFWIAAFAQSLVQNRKSASVTGWCLLWWCPQHDCSVPTILLSTWGMPSIKTWVWNGDRASHGSWSSNHLSPAEHQPSKWNIFTRLMVKIKMFGSNKHQQLNNLASQWHIIPNSYIIRMMEFCCGVDSVDCRKVPGRLSKGCSCCCCYHYYHCSSFYLDYLYIVALQHPYSLPRLSKPRGRRIFGWRLSMHVGLGFINLRIMSLLRTSRKTMFFNRLSNSYML